MNNTTLEHHYDSTIMVITSFFGFVSFMENAVVLSFIVKLVKKFSSSTEQHEFIKQLLVLCMNDTLSSVLLFWLSVFRVTGKESALICVFVGVLPVMFQLMTVSNITCICAFRYAMARNLRKRAAVRQSRFTLCLVVVNVTVGVVTVATFSATLELIPIPEGTDIVCEYIAVTSFKTQQMVVILFIGPAMLFMVVCDILCVLTILRLQIELKMVVQTEGSSNTTTSSLSQQQTVSRKFGQSRAICTIILILTCFNISILPIVVGMSFDISGTQFSSYVKHTCFLCMFLNSMINPIIIVIRIQEVRQLFMRVWRDLKPRLMFCCPCIHE